MLTIMNRGGCPRRAIELAGFTTKSGDRTIGRFGSGSIYAVALAIRSGIGIRISSEDEDGPFTMIPRAERVTVGSGAVDRIVWCCTRDSPLIPSLIGEVKRAISAPYVSPSSFTVDIGRSDWTGAWPIVREFVSNAYDADPDGFSVRRTPDGEPPDISEYLRKARADGYDSVTVVEISGSTDVDRVYDEWGSYFAFGRDGGRVDAMFESSRGMLLDPVPNWADDPFFFVRGVRCGLPRLNSPGKSIFTYGLPVELNESRSIKSDFDVAWEATRLIDEAVLSSPEIGVRFLRELVADPTSWEAVECGFYGALTPDGRWPRVFALAYGESATIRAAEEPLVLPYSIGVPGKWATGLIGMGVRQAVGPTVYSAASSDVKDVIIVHVLWSEYDELCELVEGHGLEFEQALLGFREGRRQ